MSFNYGTWIKGPTLFIAIFVGQITYASTDALSEGKDKKNILEDNFYHFFGKELSDIIFKAALDTLCPQYKK